ncbi:hypothetical protein F5Y10DRAFT_39741 [Nemania abortiva]|nr:hypothetical protein F5Y10DRAFT_39741 [Nemania abortiva]
MFSGSRRRRPPATPLNSTAANPNAATAAASAFMSAATQNPNKALSSAAAAAALRARPHTPTNVAEVQTKRTQRRSTSVSSSGSAPGGARRANGHAQLERRSSTASMTERTFRSPSPHRASTPAAREQQPPVPQIPDSHRNSATSSRATGVGMQNFRTASQKMENEHSSWHLKPAGDTSNVRTSDSIMRATKSPPPNLPHIVTSQPSRPDSRNSVNFSYPTAFRQQSPPASPTSSSISHARVAPSQPPNSSGGPSSNSGTQNSQHLVYDPNSRRMVPKAQIEEAVEYRIKQVAEKPPKRRRDGALRREGSQLAKGTVSRVKGTAVDGKQDRHELPKQEEPISEVPVPADDIPLEDETGTRATATIGPLDPNKSTQLPEPGRSKSQGQPPPTHETSDEQGDDSRSSYNIPATVQDEAALNNGKARVVNRSQAPQTVLDVLDAVPTRQTLFKSPEPSQPSRKPDINENAQDSRPSSTVEGSGLAESGTGQKAVVVENKPVVVLAGDGDNLRRSSSNSPARQARFAPGPAEKLAIRHAPLPRSASPIKSAMKHSSSIARETSPSDNMSDPSMSGAASPDQKEDPAVSRRKSVRVSFDDHGTVIVGDSSPAIEAESSTAQSPQGSKRTWFGNIGRNKKKEIALDDDEIMKPRPALPSFGSIRDKKAREAGERPLVRPLEPAYSPARSSSPDLRPQSSSTLNDSETTEEPSLGQSSDHAIGALLAQDQSSRNAANISRFREPLPPVVTSIDEYEYNSDSSQGSGNSEHPDDTMEANDSTMNSSMLSTQLTQPDLDNTPYGEVTAIKTPQNKQATPQLTAEQEQDIPEISVIQPSPKPLERSPRSHDASSYFGVPGGFPDGEPDSGCDSQPQTIKNSATENHLPSSAAVLEPTATSVEPSQAVALPQTTLYTTTPLTGLDNTEDESDESIYSDAYEDIPDVGSSGFISLDAIVESPTGEQSNLPLPQTMESLRGAIIHSEPKRDTIPRDPTATQAQSMPSQDINEWEQAKAFWRSLTAEKRRQLELEAAEEAGVEGDREEVSQPIRRSSTKKKSPEVSQPATQAPQAQSKIIQPKSRMRTSMRIERTTEPRSTQPQTSIRKTLRQNGEAQSVAKPPTRQTGTTPAATRIAPPVSSRNQAVTSRPQSAIPPAPRNQPGAQAGPTLERRGSDASDSSFKRSRRPASGSFAFRKTMRQTSPMLPHHEPTRGSGRFSLRSLSPVGSTIRGEPNAAFATSPSGMRRTLRSNSESSYEGKRSSLHFPLFTRSTKSSPKNSKWASRLEDSSDEDVGPVAGFQSRINDSSDEDENLLNSPRAPKPLGKAALHSSAAAPECSRPAPVPELEEDSPDLPDSDDDLMPSPLQNSQSRVTNSDFASRPGTGRTGSGAIGTSTLGRSRSGRGGLPPSFTSSTPPTKDTRSSLLGILRRNKRADHASKIQRSEPIDSAARRDTKLERDVRQLKDLRSDQPSSPKLQKKTSVGRSDSGGLARPTSAGNLFSRSATTGAGKRPTIGDRRSFSLGLNPNNDSFEVENGSVDSPSVLKKKKFGALRRMFKLDE